MTTKELHKILDNKNKKLTVAEIQNIICQLQDDCVSEMDKSSRNERFYAGENNAFYICRDLLDHLKIEMSEKEMTRTVVISAFPACGKSYMYKNYNGKPYTMLDSDSSKYSWIYDENGNKTDIRNPNFIEDYINHIKDNIGKVNIIFVSSHKSVRKALRDNNIKYLIVHPSLDMEDIMINRMIERGNDKKFIDFQKEHYKQFINEIIEECHSFSGLCIDDPFNCTILPCLETPLTKDKPYIDEEYILNCFTMRKGNLVPLWWNYK